MFSTLLLFRITPKLNSILYQPFFTLWWKIIAELFLEEVYRRILRDFSQSLAHISRLSPHQSAPSHFSGSQRNPARGGVNLHPASLLRAGAAGYMMDLSLRNAGNVVKVIGNVCGMRKVARGP